MRIGPPPPTSTMTLFEDFLVLCPTEPSVPYMLGLFCGFTAALWGTGWHAVHYQPCFHLPSRFQTHSWLSWSSSSFIPILALGPSHCVNEARTSEARAGFIGEGMEEVGKPRESQHLPVSFASESAQGPPHNTGPQPFTARTGGWCQEMPPGGDGDSGEKELLAEVNGSFCLGFHTSVTG